MNFRMNKGVVYDDDKKRVENYLNKNGGEKRMRWQC